MTYPIDMSVKPKVAAFTTRIPAPSAVVQDPASRACAVIDPVMDFDYAAGRISQHWPA
jgi:hypothetical protein